jgi:hypothetical protein
MIDKTKDFRTFPGCGIPGPVLGARSGDSGHMRASGGRSNYGTRRSTGINPKKLREPNTQHQHKINIGTWNVPSLTGKELGLIEGAQKKIN